VNGKLIKKLVRFTAVNVLGTVSWMLRLRVTVSTLTAAKLLTGVPLFVSTDKHCRRLQIISAPLSTDVVIGVGKMAFSAEAGIVHAPEL
jgi:hypothetical protein